jgi:hypothetical protein
MDYQKKTNNITYPLSSLKAANLYSRMMLLVQAFVKIEKTRFLSLFLT